MRLLCRDLDLDASAVDILDRWRHLNGAATVTVG
jgi:hypothetical protein